MTLTLTNGQTRTYDRSNPVDVAQAKEEFDTIVRNGGFGAAVLPGETDATAVREFPENATSIQLIRQPVGG